MESPARSQWSMGSLKLIHMPNVPTLLYVCVYIYTGWYRCVQVHAYTEDQGVEVFWFPPFAHQHGLPAPLRPRQRTWRVAQQSKNSPGAIRIWTANGGFHRRYPHSWMVFVRENPIQKWMMTGGSPISGNLQMVFFFGISWWSMGNLHSMKFPSSGLSASMEWNSHS